MQLYEVFGAGTACVVTPVRCIHYQGKDYDIPLDPNDPQSEAGPITRRLHDTLTKIQYGEIPSEWSVVIN
ncbi:branched-chain-amino-acid transaminase bat2 [Spiromyces aspiralis]|uniref:Branched-chain-amino-acid transaminase bat2 n=1 Tax=Spiromyces aspiralis TaxID=68401 RepID=A0ACC1HJB9_9FUNG|nr:branched-chain-amino-acid transaminase bat2 [Spiromyces aspiralis]